MDQEEKNLQECSEETLQEVNGGLSPVAKGALIGGASFGAAGAAVAGTSVLATDLKQGWGIKDSGTAAGAAAGFTAAGVGTFGAMGTAMYMQNKQAQREMSARTQEL